MTEPDRLKISELLVALWKDGDGVIQCLLEKNDEYHGYHVNYYCNHQDRQVCFCAEQLEFLPLAVHDKEQLKRMCINVYVGSCPHVICLIEGRINFLNDAFLQNKMEHSYSTVDMMHKYTLVKSFERGHHNAKDIVIRAGAYIEHFLLRLGKIHFLTYFLNRKGIRRTLCCSYTVLRLSILYKKTELLVALLKPEKSKQRNTNDMLSTRMFKFEDTLLYMAMERNYVHEFKQIMKMIKRKDKEGDVFDEVQLVLKTTLWGSIQKSRVEFVKILLQSHLLEFDYRYEFKTEDSDDSRTLSFSLMVQNNDVHILGLLMDYPGFNTYLAEMLPLAAMYGNIPMCEMLLKRFSKYYNKESKWDVDVYTVAVLQNYPEVLEVLLSYKVPPLQRGMFTALDFAKSLRREKCCELLRQANHKCLECTADFSPLVEVQKLGNRTCLRILPFLDLVQELVHMGFNVDFEDQNGITPVQLAIKRRDYDTVRVLLMNGADLFRGQSYMMQYGTMRLVTEVFHCNVNIYNHLSTLLELSKWYSTCRGHRDGSTAGADRAKLAFSFIALGTQSQ